MNLELELFGAMILNHSIIIWDCAFKPKGNKKWEYIFKRGGWGGNKKKRIQNLRKRANRAKRLCLMQDYIRYIRKIDT